MCHPNTKKNREHSTTKPCLPIFSSASSSPLFFSMVRTMSWTSLSFYDDSSRLLRRLSNPSRPSSHCWTEFWFSVSKRRRYAVFLSLLYMGNLYETRKLPLAFSCLNLRRATRCPKRLSSLSAQGLQTRRVRSFQRR